MADSGDGEEIALRGNDWEVVSLTASAYAAAPSPKLVEEVVVGAGNACREDKVEASQAMFMSGHFVFPGKLPMEMPTGIETDNSEVQRKPEVEELASLKGSDEIGDSVDKYDECPDLKGSAIVEDTSVNREFDGKAGALVRGSSEIQRSTTQPEPNLVEPEQVIHDSAEETNVGAATSLDVKTMSFEMTHPSAEAIADGLVEVATSKQVKGKKKVWSGIPCGPWWKRQAAYLYDHVKEASPLWSVVIAATVMGLAVLGQRWQQRKSQVLMLNLQFSAIEEKPGKMLGPISRLKEAFVSVNHDSASVRNNIYSEM
uniref:ATG8-interacting protein 1 n=1 Tax=Kalanchoe fedtschenkoi TaxID=63787 RepID=A0A7N0V9V0_KALFE